MRTTIAAICVAVCALTGRVAGQRGMETLSRDDQEVVRVVLHRALAGRPELQRAPGQLIDVTLPMCAGRRRAACFDGRLLEVLDQAEFRDKTPEWNAVDHRALRAAFTSRNATPWRFGTFNPKPEIPLASPGRATRPGAHYIRVSAPGYSPDGQYALMYFEALCGFDCGSGGFTALRRTPEGWHVFAEGPGWIA
jgi:hypothetical protein